MSSKKAAKFFDAAGSVIKKISVAAFKKVTESISNTIKKLQGFAKIGGEFIRVTGEKFKNTIKDIKNKAVEAAKKLAEDIARKAKEAAEAVERAAKAAAEAAKKAAEWVKKQAELGWCATKYFWSSSRKRDCQNEVERKYN